MEKRRCETALLSIKSIMTIMGYNLIVLDRKVVVVWISGKGYADFNDRFPKAIL